MSQFCAHCGRALDQAGAYCSACAPGGALPPQYARARHPRPAGSRGQPNIALIAGLAALLLAMLGAAGYLATVRAERAFEANVEAQRRSVLDGNPFAGQATPTPSFGPMQVGPPGSSGADDIRQMHERAMAESRARMDQARRRSDEQMRKMQQRMDDDMRRMRNMQPTLP